MTDSIFEIGRLKVSLARKKIVFMRVKDCIKQQIEISTYKEENWRTRGTN